MAPEAYLEVSAERAKGREGLGSWRMGFERKRDLRAWKAAS